MPVEHSKPGAPGFRDYARNDSIETATTRCAPSCHAAPNPRHPAHTTPSATPTPVMQRPPRVMRHPPCHVARPSRHATPTPVMWRAPRVMQHPPHCHAARTSRHAAPTPLSCCAQSQHPVMRVEHSKPGAPGFRDYARNDLVEATTPRGAHHPAARRPIPVIRTTPPRLRRAPLSCSTHPTVMLREVAASSNARRTL